MSDNELRDKLQTALSECLTPETIEKTVKKIRDIETDLCDQIETWVKDELAYNLAQHVQEMADRALKSILEGDEERLRLYLSCREGRWTGRDINHEIIHGSLFESDAIQLRRKIVDAYPDLLKNERILDLEAQQRSLVNQVNAATLALAEIRRKQKRVPSHLWPDVDSLIDQLIEGACLGYPGRSCPAECRDVASQLGPLLEEIKAGKGQP